MGSKASSRAGSSPGSPESTALARDGGQAAAAAAAAHEAETHARRAEELAGGPRMGERVRWDKLWPVLMKLGWRVDDDVRKFFSPQEGRSFEAKEQVLAFVEEGKHAMAREALLRYKAAHPEPMCSDPPQDLPQGPPQEERRSRKRPAASPDRVGCKRSRTDDGPEPVPAALRQLVWTALRDEGWSYAKGDQLNTYAFFKPGVARKQDGTPGKDYFIGEDALLEYVQAHRPDLVEKFRNEVAQAQEKRKESREEGKQRQDKTKVKRQEKRKEQRRAQHQKESSSPRARKVQRQLVFNFVWAALRDEGWWYANGDELHTFAYLKPGIKRKQDGTPGKDYFMGEDALFDYVEAHRTDLIDDFHHEQELELHKQELERMPTDVPEDLRQLVYNFVWAALRDEGWSYAKGDQLNTYAYLKPGVARKQDGTPGKDYFVGEDALLEYVQAHRLDLIQEFKLEREKETEALERKELERKELEHARAQEAKRAAQSAARQAKKDKRRDALKRERRAQMEKDFEDRANQLVAGTGPPGSRNTPPKRAPLAVDAPPYRFVAQSRKASRRPMQAPLSGASDSDASVSASAGEEDDEEERPPFQEAWAALRREGWKWIAAPKPMSGSVYAAPHVKSAQMSSLGIDCFASEDEVVDYYMRQQRSADDADEDAAAASAAEDDSASAGEEDDEEERPPFQKAWAALRREGWKWIAAPKPMSGSVYAAPHVKSAQMSSLGIDCFASEDEVVDYYMRQRKNADDADEGANSDAAAATAAEDDSASDGGEEEEEEEKRPPFQKAWAALRRKGWKWIAAPKPMPGNVYAAPHVKSAQMSSLGIDCFTSEDEVVDCYMRQLRESRGKLGAETPGPVPRSPNRPNPAKADLVAPSSRFAPIWATLKLRGWRTEQVEGKPLYVMPHVRDLVETKGASGVFRNERDVLKHVGRHKAARLKKMDKARDGRSRRTQDKDKLDKERELNWRKTSLWPFVKENFGYHHLTGGSDAAWVYCPPEIETTCMGTLHENMFPTEQEAVQHYLDSSAMTLAQLERMASDAKPEEQEEGKAPAVESESDAESCEVIEAREGAVRPKNRTRLDMTAKEVWAILKNRGWHKTGPGLASSTYMMPHIKRRCDGKLGVNMFAGEGALLEWWRTKLGPRKGKAAQVAGPSRRRSAVGSKKRAREGGAPPLPAKRSKRDEEPADKEASDDTAASSGDEAASSSLAEDPAQRDWDFNGVWRMLKAKGWRHRPGTGLASFIYMKPHVKRLKDCVFGVDAFEGEDALVEYWRKRVNHQLDPEADADADADDLTPARLETPETPPRALQAAPAASSPLAVNWADMEASGWSKQSCAKGTGRTLYIGPLAAPPMAGDDYKVDGVFVFDDIAQAKALYKRTSRKKIARRAESVVSSDESASEASDDEASSDDEDRRELASQSDAESATDLEEAGAEAGLQHYEAQESAPVSLGQQDPWDDQAELDDEALERELEQIEARVSACQRAWTGRDREIRTIASLMGTACQPSPPMLITGDTATGKSSVLRDLLERSESDYAIVDCELCYTPAVLFKYLLRGLPSGGAEGDAKAADDSLDPADHSDAGSEDDGEGGLDALSDDGDRAEYERERKRNLEANAAAMAALFAADEERPPSSAQQPAARSSSSEQVSHGLKDATVPPAKKAATARRHCSTLADFGLALSEALRKRKQRLATFYVVLEHAEQLHRRFPALTQGLLGLDRLTGANVCVVLVSSSVSVTFEKLARMKGLCAVQFSPYTENQTRLIVLAAVRQELGLAAEEAAPAWVSPFCKELMNVFFRKVRDLRELKRIALDLVQFMQQRAGKEEVMAMGPSETRQLLDGRVRQALLRLFRHDLGPEAADVEGSETRALLESTEIPYNSKILLVAGFLASYNLPDADRKLFGSHRALTKRQKVRKGYKRAGGATKRAGDLPPPQLQLGPRKFSIERLFLLYCALLENLVGSRAASESYNTDMYKHLSLLVSSGMLTQVSGDHLTKLCYKCTAPTEYVRAVASTVTGLDLFAYIIDM